MTNVKLKLMFYILNALVAADLAHARPNLQIVNITNLVANLSNNNSTEDFNLPVDGNADTLIVAKDVMDAEETNSQSKIELDAIVDAEQDRDEALSAKTMKDSTSILELTQEDADGFRKQLNTSSPILEEIFDAETGREEMITEVLFRQQSEFSNDIPRFEYLVGIKLNETAHLKKTNVTENIENIDLKEDNTTGVKKIDYVELVELAMPTKLSENKSAYTLANITGHEVENDVAPDTSFTDVQTLFLACFGTLLPLLGVLCVTLLVRCMCRRWCRKCCKQASESIDSESSDDKQDDTRQQLKSTGEESVLAEETEGVLTGAPPANGSIITMTLKNNHLIVETEERNDITKNGRETKMKYSPDNDGIFVVEVQQSAVYKPTKSVQNSPPHDPQISTNLALIHRAPEDLDTNDKVSKVDSLNPDEVSEVSSGRFDKSKPIALSNTGLSISDLSMSSIGSHNISYSYGSQMGYEQGPFGYPIYAGYEVPKESPIGDTCIIHDNSREPLLCKTPTDPDKPVVTAAIFKQDSIIGNDALQGPGYCIEGSSDGPLLSDVQAREVSLQQLHDKMEKKIENGVAVPVVEKIESPKKVLNRADSLPVRLEENNVPVQIIDKDKNLGMETIIEDVIPPPKDFSRGKRASLPIIRTEMYESVKDAILPGTSPKFEKLTNEHSPSDVDCENSGPMITITEHLEGSERNDDVTS